MDPLGRDAQIETLIEREGALVDRVRSIETEWNGYMAPSGGDDIMEGDLRERTTTLMIEAEDLAEEVAPIFMEAPITSLGNARFGWAVYEIANARLNLTYLLLFGVNQVAARRNGLVPERQGV